MTIAALAAVVVEDVDDAETKLSRSPRGSVSVSPALTWCLLANGSLTMAVSILLQFADDDRRLAVRTRNPRCTRNGADVSVSAEAERGGHSLVADVVGAKAVDAFHARQLLRCDRRDRIEMVGWRSSAGSPAGRR